MGITKTSGQAKFNKEKGANWKASEPLPHKLVWKTVHGQRVQVKVYPKLATPEACRRVRSRQGAGVRNNGPMNSGR